MKSKKQFPLFFVNLATFVTLLPFSILFSFESLTTDVKLRWKSNVTAFTFDTPVNYRDEMLSKTQNIAGFAIWTFQVSVTLLVVLYHLLTPHHPKYYSTKKNIISIIAHMIGGTIGIVGLYTGMLIDSKKTCLFAVVSALLLHWPSVIWQSRQTHGQRETSVPAYLFLTWLLLQGYIEFFLYNGSYQSVYTCAMTLNVFAMVRLFGFIAGKVNMETHVDKSVLFAGFCNASFIGGAYISVLFIFCLFIWNFYFSLIKPFPRFMLQIERGYNDTVPDTLEQKRGIKFNDELERMEKVYTDRKEAITHVLWKVLAGNNSMDLQEVVDLYRAWGMPDAEDAAKETFEKVDEDDDHLIQYDEFKKGFEHIVEGIYLKGEFDSIRKPGVSPDVIKAGRNIVTPVSVDPELEKRNSQELSTLNI